MELCAAAVPLRHTDYIGRMIGGDPVIEVESTRDYWAECGQPPAAVHEYRCEHGHVVRKPLKPGQTRFVTQRVRGSDIQRAATGNHSPNRFAAFTDQSLNCAFGQVAAEHESHVATSASNTRSAPRATSSASANTRLCRSTSSTGCQAASSR